MTDVTRGRTDLANLPDGVSVETEGHLQVVIIEHLSEELREHVKKYLVDICRGPNIAQAVPAWNYSSTVAELNVRIQKKDPRGQIGMVGELLTHSIAPLLFPHLAQASVYFNKEDRSVKKGFDLVFFEQDESRFWYAEVKSGKPSASETPLAKASALLKKAAKELIEMLNSEDRASLWDSAIIDATLALQSSRAVTAQELLSKDSASAGASESWDKHVILTAAVFADVGLNNVDPLSISSSQANPNTLDERFHQELWLVFQKSTFEAVVDFISEEASN